MGYEIRQYLTGVNCEWGCNSPQWIVIHNTANGTSREGTALGNAKYFQSYRGASAHYFIDDGDVIWQVVRDCDTAWHCGDSWSHNGCTNYNSIGIETCERADRSFSEHEIQVLSWLVNMLMEKYGIPPERVCRHHDVTGKICPAGYIDNGAWEALKARITSEEEIVTPEQMEYIINETVNRLVNFEQNGVKLRDRWQGTDEAANAAFRTVADGTIAHQVWNFEQNGTLMRDRVQGTDEAANATLRAVADGTIAHEVWNFDQNGTLMRDRVQGTDEAGQMARKYLPAIYGKLK